MAAPRCGILVVGVSAILCAAMGAHADGIAARARRVTRRLVANRTVCGEHPHLLGSTINRASLSHDPTPQAGTLSWQSATLPSGLATALKDVAITKTDTGVRVLAVGEGGVVLSANLSGGRVSPFTALLIVGFPSYYYGVAASGSRILVSGFTDSATGNYGFVRSSVDGGATWTAERVVDPAVWLGGPIRCVGNGSRCIVPAVTGATMYTTDDGLNAESPTWKTVPCGDAWHSGPFVADGETVRVVGVQDCVSVDRGDSFTCGPSIDSVFDGGIVVDTASKVGLTGGGAISPALSGWVHHSTDGGKSWVAGRALTAPYPIRFVGVFGSMSVAAGGDYRSGVGGVYVSSDGGKSWTLSITTGAEMAACTADETGSKTILVCVGSSAAKGSHIIYTAL